MPTRKQAFGTRATLTISLGGLANGSYREATEIDNSSDGAVDGILHGLIKGGTTPTVGNTITIYLSGSDGTTARPGNLSGTDGAVTPSGEQTQWEIGRIIPVDATTGHVYEFYIGGLAQLFGGVMPKKFSVIVLNGSGQALDATGGNHSIFYTPITETIA